MSHYTTWLRWGILAGLFLIPFIPFIIADGRVFPNFFFPYITGKNFAFRILVELMAGGYLLLALRDPKYRPRASWIFWAVAAFVAWMAVATLFSVDPIKSFWSNFERMEGYLTVLHLFVYFVVMGAVLATEDLWNRFLNTSIGVSAVMGFYALAQALHLFGFAPSSQSGARADTSFGNATYLAVYMLFHIFLTLFMLTRTRKSPLLQSLYGVALVLQFVALFLTETRGAQLGVIGGIVVAALWVLWQAREPQWRFLRRSALGGLIAIAVLVGGFIAIRNTSFVRNSTALSRLASISLNDSTVRSRLIYIWPMALKGGLEKPVTGWGQENFNYVFNQNYQPGMWDQEQWFDRAHNQFLDWLIAGGVPAFLLYVSFFALAVWAIIRSSRLSAPEQGALLGLLAGYAFNNLFVFDNLISAAYFFALLAFVHGLSRRELPGRLWLSRPMGEHGLAVAAPVVLAAIALGGWALNAPGMARANTLVSALQTSGQDAAAGLTGFKQALEVPTWPGTPLGYQEAVEQMFQVASAGVAPSTSVSPQLKQDYYTTTYDAAQALLAQRRGDARLELYFGSFLGSFGQNAEALAHLKTALELSPDKQQILYQLGLLYLQSGDAHSALAHLKKAFDEAPENDQARVFYAAGYYYAGDRAAGDALLTERWGTTAVDDPQLLTVYTNTKMYDRVIAIWQGRVAKSPNDPQTLLGLASAYFVSGDKQNTIATLQKIIQINPAAAAQVQQLIDQIKAGTLKP